MERGDSLWPAAPHSGGEDLAETISKELLLEDGNNTYKGLSGPGELRKAVNKKDNVCVCANRQWSQKPHAIVGGSLPSCIAERYSVSVGLSSISVS